MKILFSPSEGKTIPHKTTPQNGKIPQNATNCIQHRLDSINSTPTSQTSFQAALYEGLFLEHSAIKDAIKAYAAFLQSASEGEISALFGSKHIDLDELNIAQNLLNAPNIESIRLYNGVGYKALDFASLDSKAQKYLYNHLYIFSNLFGVVRADWALPYYNVHQGKGRGAFELKALYRALKPALDVFFAHSDVLDLRAEAYIKAYMPKSCAHYTQVNFLKNGKKVSHYAKYYRGLYARAVAQNHITSTKMLIDFTPAFLSLKNVTHAQNTTILTYEARH